MNNFAPEYTKRERISLILKIVAWMIPAYLVVQFWFFDWLSDYAANAHCYQYGSINGVHLIFYGLFVFMPLSFALLLFLIEGRRSLKVMKLGQNPLPNEKVLRPTKYRYGIAAKIQPLAIFSIMIFLIGLSIWGGFQAHALTQDIKPCVADNPASLP